MSFLTHARLILVSASPARFRPASWTFFVISPREWSTSRSPAKCSSRSRPSAPTCTTSTARSAPSTVPRRFLRPAIAAGFRRLVDQTLAQCDRDCVGPVFGAEAGQGVLGVGLDRFLAEAKLPRGDDG